MLGLKYLICLIKWIVLELTYIIVYLCLDMIQIQHATLELAIFNMKLAD
jgi:hypothetical protein